MKKKDDKTPVTFRIEPDVKKAVDKFLSARDVKISDLINLSLFSFLSLEEGELDGKILTYQKRMRQ